jgi:hypothetical protein
VGAGAGGPGARQAVRAPRVACRRPAGAPSPAPGGGRRRGAIGIMIRRLPPRAGTDRDSAGGRAWRRRELRAAGPRAASEGRGPGGPAASSRGGCAARWSLRASAARVGAQGPRFAARVSPAALPRRPRLYSARAHGPVGPALAKPARPARPAPPLAARGPPLATARERRADDGQGIGDSNCFHSRPCHARWHPPSAPLPPPRSPGRPGLPWQQPVWSVKRVCRAAAVGPLGGWDWIPAHSPCCPVTGCQMHRDVPVAPTKPVKTLRRAWSSQTTCAVCSFQVLA